MIVYVACSTNNAASTVYDLFLGAVQQFGLPSRVCSDQGGENVLVAQHMIEHRGADRRSMITGSSTHNQRIERLWRDLHRCVGQLYYRLFYNMENIDILNPNNECHLYALHYIYFHRINNSLRSFKQSWNHHEVRSEHNRTPHQLFTEGALRLQSTGLAALDFFNNVSESYGIEELGIVPEEDGEGVEVPQNRLRLQDEHYALLQQQVDRFAHSDNYGIELYEQTVQFISDLVS